MGASHLVPRTLAGWMRPFQAGFTAPTWQHVLVLIAGAILTPGRGTVAAALRVIGCEQDPHFTNPTSRIRPWAKKFSAAKWLTAHGLSARNRPKPAVVPT